LEGIEELLRNPDVFKPFNMDIAAAYRNDRSEYEKTAREWTKKIRHHGKLL
jgi:ubiquitin-protein ligase